MNCRKRRTGCKGRKKVKKIEKHQIDKAEIDAARYGHYMMIFCHDAQHIKKADDGSAANTAAQWDSFCRLLFETAVCQKKVNKGNHGEKIAIQEFFHNAGSSLALFLIFRASLWSEDSTYYNSMDGSFCAISIEKAFRILYYKIR